EVLPEAERVTQPFNRGRGIPVPEAGDHRSLRVLRESGHGNPPVMRGQKRDRPASYLIVCTLSRWLSGSPVIRPQVSPVARKQRHSACPPPVDSGANNGGGGCVEGVGHSISQIDRFRTDRRGT